MKIKKAKKFIVLKKPLFDESMIDNIYENEKTVINQQTQVPELVGEELIDYKFYFVADMRVAITNNLNKVRFSVRKGLKQKNHPFFKDLTNKTSKGIVAALFAKNADRKSAIFTADRDGLIHRSYIDLFKYFDNFKLRNAKKLSDRELFGTILTTSVINTKKMRKLGKNQQLSQKSITSLKRENLNSRQFSANYEKAISIGRDPASLLFPTDDETPADPRRRGTFSRKSILTGNSATDGCLTSLRYQAIGTSTSDTTSTDKSSVSQLPAGSSVAITTMQPNRYQIIPVSVTLKKSDLAGRRNFFVTLDIINSRRIIAQTLVIKINHQKNLDDYYAPISGIESKISFPFDSNKKSARISLKKDDPNIAGCDIYIREISETYPLLSTQFKKVKRVRFRSGGRTYSESVRYPVNEVFTIPHVEDKMTVMRVVPISRTGKTFGNFSSSVKKNGPFVPFRAAVSTMSTDKGILVSLQNVSPNVAGVCFQKRNITLHEKNFTKVIEPLESHPNNTSIDSPGQGAGSLKSKGGVFSTLDRHVREGNLYEYRALLYLREGVDRISVMSRFETFITPMKFISTTISSMRVSTPKSKPIRSEVAGINAEVNISFNISFEIAPTDADKIMDGLAAAGLSNLYSAELASVKSSLQSLIFFNIERYNMYTGETFYLGSFPPDKMITDDGITTDALCPIMGQLYRYRITPCLVQPDVAVQSIQSVASSRTEPSPALGSRTALRNPSTYAKLRNTYTSVAAIVSNPSILEANYINTKGAKNFSRSSFEKGTVPTSNSIVSLSDFSTGDFVDKTITTGMEYVKIKNVSVSMGKRAGPILRWKSAGANTSKAFVDFFVILAKKQGEKYLVGTCHRLSNNDFRFVDFSNKDYVGVIEYFLKPVFLSGKMGDELSLGSALMLDRNTRFRRGN